MTTQGKQHSQETLRLCSLSHILAGFYLSATKYNFRDKLSGKREGNSVRDWINLPLQAKRVSNKHSQEEVGEGGEATLAGKWLGGPGAGGSRWGEGERGPRPGCSSGPVRSEPCAPRAALSCPLN